MNPQTDWASADPTQNITLAEADQFKNQIASALSVQFADRFVKTATGEVIGETEIRRNPLPGAAINLWGTLAGAGAAAMNIAQMRTAIRAAGKGHNPAGDLENILHQALPKSDVATMMLRIPAVGAAIGSVMSQIG